MNRIKSFTGTGVAPNGRLYPADLNAIQDAAAAEVDLAQVIKVGELHVGENGLALVRYATGVMRLEGGLRVDGAITGGVIQIPVYTTTQRDALGSGLAPAGTQIFNSTVGLAQINVGTDGARNWKSVPFALENLTVTRTTDISMSTADTYADALTLPCPAGTYLVLAYLTIEPADNQQDASVKLHDGTTIFANGYHSADMGGGEVFTMSLHGFAVFTSTTTLKCSVAPQGNVGLTVRAQIPAPLSESSNTASRLSVVKIG
jgi:hypothetical protein